MNKEEIKALFKDDIEWRRKKIHEYITSVNPIEDRLEVWRSVPEHLVEVEPWVIELPEFEDSYGEIEWYDDLYVERHSTVDLRNIGSYVEHKWSKEKIRDFEVACCNAGYMIFVFDW